MVRDAETYLSRHLGNKISLRLVEILRGEEIGIVRQLQVIGQSGRLVFRTSASNTARWF